MQTRARGERTVRRAAGGRRRAGALLAALGGCALLGCGSELSEPTGATMASAPETSDAAADGPLPALRVALEPSPPRPGQRVTARVEPREWAGRKLRFEYRWSVNGREVEARSESLQVEGESGKGTPIEVSVVAVDGERRSQPARASTRIGNTPPVLHGVVLEPLGPVTAGNDVTAVPKASDADGDALSFECRWDVNGATVSRSCERLAADRFRRGDAIRVTVVASDGEAESDPVASAPIQVENAAPKVASTPGDFGEDGRFVYRVAAVDPDGDSTFGFRLLQGPAGMQIDPVDGTVSWAPSEDQAGQHPVKIEVSDRKGGSVVQSFVMELDFEDAGGPPASKD